MCVLKVEDKLGLKESVFLIWSFKGSVCGGGVVRIRNKTVQTTKLGAPLKCPESLYQL